MAGNTGIGRRGDGIFAGGGGVESDGLRVGLKPQKGWAKRNYHYMRRSLLPTLMASRAPAHLKGQPDYLGLAQHEIEVTWIGHASFLVRTPWMNILIDPNWALWHGPLVKRAKLPGFSLEHLPRIDLVLITHAHFDHLHRPSLRRIASGQTVLVPRGVSRLLKRMPFGEVREMDNWEGHDAGEVEIVFTPSYHWGARYLHDTHRGFGGFLIRTPHSTLYHSGDSAYFDGFAELGERYEVDTALLPIGAYEAPSGRDVQMNPEEALQAFSDLGAGRMIPMHYGAFALGNEHIDEPIRRLHHHSKRRGLCHRVITAREGEQIRL
ncbi:MAG: MBL fold metallo-hydrolase [Verrucomicrobiales bacterium]